VHNEQVTTSNDMRALVVARLSGYAEVERLQRAELAAMTEQEAARIADELLQHLALLPQEPDRGSGLVEQQRIFRRAHS
jgi:hypothetical protein